MMYFPFTNDFLKQFYSYKRPFQEVQGYSVKHDENGEDTIFLNALGVDPTDVEISVKSEYPRNQILTVTGTTKNKEWDEDFSINFAFSVRKPIKKILKSFRSGLLMLKIEYDKPVQPDVEIVEI